ncbi:UDP-glucose/GDP-mannose dehydrogenase family protein [Actinokineospora sp. PR83]|uniref:UDP-glucose dehydrogenase family protein n=1 Tax=Actinokineospora sp. PR83 TaxID=2884908 RepID=UPI001F338EAF|nr:UDP-glucose/GDP-mannose dehydrogenase family protein [Actinokineospora sp. PR83]MCG8919867.1 UDP-glucose/GDP-mannose dehydrogenase family protein [Actinokineospora sp. PR83]
MAAIGVIGAGYVGLTTAACFAALGHRVVCADRDADRISALRRGEVTAHEPGLPDLVSDGLRSGALCFTGANAEAFADTDFVFLCVPTPSGPDGAAELGVVRSVLAEIGSRDCRVVVKSTVPPGTAAALSRETGIALVSNPEFLREGHTVADFLHPQRIVVGAADPEDARAVLALYPQAPAIVTDPTTAELVKYAANCFLAMKLSYANSLAELCEVFDADVAAVTAGIGSDTRIGPDFLRPGPGWGGSCFPKDTRALAAAAAAAGVDFPLLTATMSTNDRQADRVLRRVVAETGPLRGARVGVLGLTFKAGTDDLRDSPALRVAERLVAAGAAVRAFDPCVRGPVDGVEVVESVGAAVEGAVAAVVLTEWPEFGALSWAELKPTMALPVLVDTRCVVPVEAAREAGMRVVRWGSASVG